MKRPLPDGTTHLLFTGLELLRRVAWRPWCLRLGQTSRDFTASSLQASNCGHFWSPKQVRRRSVALEAATRKKPRRERTQRVDQAGLLRRIFAVEVFACVRCRGRRRVLAGHEGSSRGARDSGAPGVAHEACEPGPGAIAPSGRVVLRLKTAKRPGAPAAPPPRRAVWAGVCPKRAARLFHRPGAPLGRPPSAALLGPSAPAPLNSAPISPMLRFGQSLNFMTR
jgi:hypothetical protein